MEGYVYKWVDSSNEKMYIGSHNGKKKDYIGSGKLFKRAYDIRPECFTREILYMGADFAEVEELILETLDVKNDTMYYNLTNRYGGGDLYDKTGESNSFYGKTHSEESREKIRDWNLNSSPSKRKVKEIESGLVFNSIRECGQYFNIHSTTVSTHLKNNRPVLMGPNKGKYFIYNE